MIDLHNHMLPGLDDGARDWEQSLLMARMAVEDGIEAVVCTPHWMSGLYCDNTRTAILRVAEVLRERLARAGIPLRVYPGAELHLDYDLPRMLASAEILTLNDTGRYALIELHGGVLPRNMENFFWELEARGVTPVLSHPERNRVLQQDPVRLYRWVEAGVMVQITSSSLLGRFGGEAERFARLLLRHNLVHVLATDAHGHDVRTPRLSEGLGEAARSIGEEAARRLVLENPRGIVEGKPVTLAGLIPLGDSSGRFSAFRRFFSFLGPGPQR